MIELSDADILSRLTNFEDAFVERKSTGDMRDLLKSAVAFANSTPMGYPAILFYGVTDKGVPEGRANLDTLQRTISEKLIEAYPPIYYLPKVLQQNGKQFLAVIVPGSENRPHFAGQSYIRDGSQTLPASKEQFERLIAERSSKVYEILKWKNRQITVTYTPSDPARLDKPAKVLNRATTVCLTDCNLFYVTVQAMCEGETSSLLSFTLSRLEISYDNIAKRLLLIVAGF